MSINKKKLPAQPLFLISSLTLMLTDDPFLSLTLYSLCFGAAFKDVQPHITAVFRLRPTPLSAAAICFLLTFAASVVLFAMRGRADGRIPALCVYCMTVSADDTFTKNTYEPAIFSVQVVAASFTAILAIALSNSIVYGAYLGYCTFLLFAAVRLLAAKAIKRRPVCSNINKM